MFSRRRGSIRLILSALPSSALQSHQSFAWGRVVTYMNVGLSRILAASIVACLSLDRGSGKLSERLAHLNVGGHVPIKRRQQFVSVTSFAWMPRVDYSSPMNL